MRRSRGGFTTKIHALIDSRGLPIRQHLSEGQTSDCREGSQLINAVQGGATFLADKAYGRGAICSRITEQGGCAQSPQSAIGVTASLSAASCFMIIIWSSACSEKSNTPEARLQDTTSEVTTSSQPSSPLPPSMDRHSCVSGFIIGAKCVRRRDHLIVSKFVSSLSHQGALANGQS